MNQLAVLLFTNATKDTHTQVHRVSVFVTKGDVGIVAIVLNSCCQWNWDIWSNNLSSRKKDTHNCIRDKVRSSKHEWFMLQLSDSWFIRSLNHWNTTVNRNTLQFDPFCCHLAMLQFGLLFCDENVSLNSRRIVVMHALFSFSWTFHKGPLDELWIALDNHPWIVNRKHKFFFVKTCTGMMFAFLIL